MQQGQGSARPRQYEVARPPERKPAANRRVFPARRQESINYAIFRGTKRLKYDHTLLYRLHGDRHHPADRAPAVRRKENSRTDARNGPRHQRIQKRRRRGQQETIREKAEQIKSGCRENDITISLSIDAFTLGDQRETHIRMTYGEIDGDERSASANPEAAKSRHTTFRDFSESPSTPEPTSG